MINTHATSIPKEAKPQPQAEYFSQLMEPSDLPSFDDGDLSFNENDGDEDFSNFDEDFVTTESPVTSAPATPSVISIQAPTEKGSPKWRGGVKPGRKPGTLGVLGPRLKRTPEPGLSGVTITPLAPNTILAPAGVVAPPKESEVKGGLGPAKAYQEQRPRKLPEGKIQAFACPQCPQTFSLACSLKRHVKIKHLGISKFKCKYCGKPCQNSNDLNAHVRALHLGERPFQCDNCGESFGFGGTLQKHKKRCLDPNRRFFTMKQKVMVDDAKVDMFVPKIQLTEGVTVKCESPEGDQAGNGSITIKEFGSVLIQNENGEEGDFVAKEEPVDVPETPETL